MKRPSWHIYRESQKSRLISLLLATLLVSTMQAVGPNSLREGAEATLATTSCGTYAGTAQNDKSAEGSGSGVDLGDFKVLPLHG